MYETFQQARAELSAHFKPEDVEMLLATLQPAIGFRLAASGAEAAPGGSRLDGGPDLPPGLSWPIREVPANLDEIAERGGLNHGEAIRKALSRPTPYPFMAQIDLSQAAGLGAVAESLPSEGRLLFFYDLDNGPWNNSRETCLVLWDTSPRESLVHQPIPQILQDLREEQAREWNESAAQHGFAPMPDQYSPYWGPAQPMRLVSELRLPAKASIEAANAPGLAKALENEAFAEAYDDILSGLQEGDGLSRASLLGSPLPEQDDPRYDAVVLDMFGKPFLSSAEWKTAFPAVSKAAAGWLLLLQVDLAAWLRLPYMEGTVYFVISRENLAARAFDQVFAIYQQT